MDNAHPSPAATPPRPPERVFVIKLDGNATPGHLSGRVEHVLTGWQAEFEGLDELRARLCQAGPHRGEAPCRS